MGKVGPCQKTSKNPKKTGQTSSRNPGGSLLWLENVFGLSAAAFIQRLVGVDAYI